MKWLVLALVLALAGCATKAPMYVCQMVTPEMMGCMPIEEGQEK